MTEDEAYKVHIQYTFNAFCKIVLYHAALGAYKKLRKKQQFEVSLDYLCEFDFEPVTTADEYFVQYDMPTAFTIRGKTVIVESEQLAAALLNLPEKRREVLFLRYYLGYSDTEIGRLFGVCRSTIFRKRIDRLHPQKWYLFFLPAWMFRRVKSLYLCGLQRAKKGGQYNIPRKCKNALLLFHAV